MKIFFLPAFLFLLIGVAYTQSINIRIKNFEDGRSILFSLEGENVTLIDSIPLIEKAEFQFNLDGEQTGFYRLAFNKNKYLDFIYDEEEIEIETDANNVLDGINVIKSESNRVYYEFVKLNKAYKTKTELLQLILARYPKDDDYYQTTKVKLVRVQEDYLYFVNVTAQVNPKSFIAGYVRSAQLPVVDTEIPFEKQLLFLKSHALDNINFYDEGLIHSDAFTSKTIEYLTYYRNPQLPIELLEKEFMAAIDTLLTKAKVNAIVYQHIVEYLIDGFKKFGFDNVIDYIVENYIIKDDLCLDEKLGDTLERRIQQARNFKIGSIVPDIILPDLSGSLVDINKINSDKILIIFYASWCPHCQTLLPQIHALYQTQKEMKFEVLAVSIDTSRTDWLKFVSAKKRDWINVSDLNGWTGKATTDYYLYATPAMFLIDKQLKLISNPSSIDELRSLF